MFPIWVSLPDTLSSLRLKIIPSFCIPKWLELLVLGAVPGSSSKLNSLFCFFGCTCIYWTCPHKYKQSITSLEREKWLLCTFLTELFQATVERVTSQHHFQRTVLQLLDCAPKEASLLLRAALLILFTSEVYSCPGWELCSSLSCLTSL